MVQPAPRAWAPRFLTPAEEFAFGGGRSPRRGDCFFLGNDELNVPANAGNRTTALVGVASPHVLHVLGIMARGGRVDRVVLVDVNPGQLSHFATLCRTLLKAPDRPAFVQTLLGIRLGRHALQLLTAARPRTPGRILGSVHGPRSLAIERQLWADVEFHPEEFEAVHKRPAWLGDDGLIVPSRLFGREVRQSVHVLGCRPNAPGTYPSTLSYGRGFLASESAYQATRSAVRGACWAFVRGGLSTELPAVLEALSSFRVLLCVSNVFHEFFIALDPALADLAVFLATEWRGGMLVADLREPESIHPIFRNPGPRAV